MLPFPRMVVYGTDLVPYKIRYNFDTSSSTGEFTVQPNSGVLTPIPVSYPGYTNMLRVQNISTAMVPAPSTFSIGQGDFEYTLTFYLYSGGSSYDVIMHYGNTDGVNIQSGLWLQIGNEGLGSRLQFGVGVVGESTEYSCNVVRSQLENKVNAVTIRRRSGRVSAYLNGTQLLIGSGSNPSNQLDLPNTSAVNNLYPWFGEYFGSGTAKWGVDVGLLYFGLRLL